MFPGKRQTFRELLKIQRLMAGTVMQPLTPDGNMRSTNNRAIEFIKPNDQLTSFERLEIYNRQYWYRIKDSFYEDYSGLRIILGERRFERMALAYLEHCPSESFTLRNLGRMLIEFLQENPRWIRPRHRPALDMARLEWAHIEAFDREAKPRLRVESLAGADPAALRMVLQPYVSFLDLGYEVDKLLIRARHDQGLRNEASNTLARRRASKRSPLAAKLVPKKIFLAVHRQDETVFYKRLQSAQYRVLTELRDGATVGEACEDLAQFSPRDASKIGEWFKLWATLGWFCEGE